MNNGDQNQEQPADTNMAPISCDAEKKKEEQQRRNEWLKEKMEFRRKQQIQFIMTQTNYDESEATQKLETCNNDVMKVVGEYLGITSVKKDENAKKTKNQKVYSVIRDIMDSGSRNYMMQQERAKKIEEIKELKKSIEMKKQNEQNEQNEQNCDNNLKTIKEKID
jgi:hypothetical protein